jgi:hypothetical protein
MRALVVAAVAVLVAVAACDSDTPRDPPGAVLGCAMRAEGAPGLPHFSRVRDVRAGPVTFYGLKSLAATASKHPGVVFKRRKGGYGAMKMLVGVEAGRRVTVVIGPSSRGRAGLVYGKRSIRSGPLLHLRETERSVQLVPCERDHPRFDGRGKVGARTDFAGGFVAAEPQCLQLQVTSKGRPARAVVIPYGVPPGSC